MTTRTDTIPVAVAPTGGGFRWRRLFFSFLLTILAIAVFVAAFMIGFVRMHEARALPGVEVAGIAIGGLDRHDAELKLRQELPSLSAGQLTVSFAEYTARIPYADFGRDHNIGLMIDQAFALGHGGSIWDDFRAQIGVLMNGVVVEPSVTWNGDQLVESMQAIAQDVTIYPVDAAIVRETGRYSALPSSEGRSVDIEEGLARALAAIDNTSPASQTIQLDPVVLHPSITTAQAEQAVTRAEQAVAGGIALTGLEGPASIDEATLRGWVYINEALPGTWPVIIEREPIVQYVAQFSEQLYVEPVDATFSFNNEEKIAAVVPGKDGQQLDVATSADRVLAVLEGRVADGSPGNPVSLAIVAVEPNFGTEQAEAMAPRFEKLSAWTTNFVPAETNGFGVNISLPTSEIHGTVLQPGDDFDFLTVIGPITRERGYRSGAGIQRGRTNLDGVLGGGMCSCSTTIFNAALRAGLEMGKRAPHYYYISRYPVGLDATVWYTASNRVTMTFTNDTDYPVLIRGINKRGAVTFQIWSVPDGRTVQISKPRVTDRVPAHDTIQWTDKLRPGQLKRIEWPAAGFKAWVTRTVRDANGNIIHQDTYYSHYKRVNGVTLKGRGPTSPPAGTVERVGGGGN